MRHPASIRAEHGDVFSTILEDGTTIPWRPLSMGEYIEYDALIKSGRYPLAYIENEIFSKCVTSDFYKKNMNDTKAGIVSTVSAGILAYSGPSTISELNQILDINRGVSQQVLHQIVSIICQGFPSYKPEEVYDMDYRTIMLRLAQAEDKLVKMGLMTEPINFFNPEEEEEQKRPNTDTTRLLDDFYEQEGMKTSLGERPTPTGFHMPQKPVSSKQTIISTQEMKEHTTMYTGHESEDRFLLEHDMVKDTAPIYSDYVEQLKKDGKLVMKTPEERLAAAKKRSEAHRKHIEAVDKERSIEERDLQKLLVEQRKSKLERQKQKTKKRR